MPILKCANGYDLFYEKLGPDSARHKVLLIMGFACDRNYWDPFAKQILEWNRSARDNTDPRHQYQLMWSDSRGFGQSSECYYNRARTSSMAEDQLELLVHAGFLPAANVHSSTVESDGSVFPHLLHVVGWSMGGMIATHLATLIQAHHGVHPHSILASLTLASSSPGGWSAPSGLSLVTLPRSVPPWRGVLLCLRTILSLRTSARIRRILELHYAPSFYAQHKHELSDVYAQRAPFDRSIFSYLFSLFQHALAVTFHFSSPSELLALRGSGLPVLVIAGEDDNLVSIENSRVLAQQLGATLAVAPASGHMVHVEDRDWFARQTREHFTRASEYLERRHEEVLASLLKLRAAREQHRQLRSVSTSISSVTLPRVLNPSVGRIADTASDEFPLPRHSEALYHQRLQVVRSVLQVAFKVYAMLWLLRTIRGSNWWTRWWQSIRSVWASIA